MHRPFSLRMPHQRVFAAGLVALLALGSGCDASPEVPVPGANAPVEGGSASQEDSGVPGDSGSAGMDDRDAAPNGDSYPGADNGDAAAQAEAEQKPGFSRDRLEQLVAPIALYPDQLLQQVLMAATYPGEVAEAGEWAKANGRLTGKALDDAIADKGWDVSVNSLVHATQALDLMTADPDWTRDLGDAFLAQQDDVLNAVQVMRSRACDLGNLKTSEQQQVIIEDAPRASAPPAQQYQQGNAPAPMGGAAQPQYAEQPYGSQYPATYGQPGYYVVPPPPRIVRIVPVNPSFLYVPTYNPRVMFGFTAPAPYYPRVYAYPQVSVGIAPILSFGMGIAVGNLIWGDLDWDHRRVYRTRYGRGYYGGDRDWYNDHRNWNQSMWRHEQWHRRGISYQRPEYGNVWGYRSNYQDRYRDNQYRDWEKNMRKSDDRMRKDYEKRWKDQDKRYGRDDDRFRKENEKRWNEQQKNFAKDADRQRKDDDRRGKDDDKRWKEQQDRSKGDDRRGGSPDRSMNDRDRSKNDRDASKNDRDGSKNERDRSKDDRDRSKDDRSPGMGRPAPHGGGNQDRGGNPKGGAKNQDHGSSMKQDRGGSPKGGAPDRGAWDSGSGQKGGANDRGAKPANPKSGNSHGGYDRGSNPKGGGQDRGGQQNRGGVQQDRGGQQNKGGQQNRGGQPSMGGQQNRGGQQDRGGQQNRGGVQQDRGGQQNKGGQQNRGGQQNKGGGQNKGGQQNKGGGKDNGKDRNGGR